MGRRQLSSDLQVFCPKILLGLTATPERMDGTMLPPTGNRCRENSTARAGEILCPFHYFGVADPVAIDQDRFWRNGRYDAELEKVYTGAHILAKQRRCYFTALNRYEPDLGC